MFDLVGIVALLVFIVARPLDFFEPLRGMPFLYIFFALAVFGLLVDARLGGIKLRATPQLPWLASCVVLALAATAVMAPDGLTDAAVALCIVLGLYVVVAQGSQHFKTLEVLAGAVLLCTLWIGAVCTHQGLQPTVCVAVDQKDDHSAMGRPEERPCDDVTTCYLDPPEPQAIYRCERAGLLGITSIDGGRVRYVGVLHDPNEVALTVAAGLPLAVGFYRRRRTFWRWLLCACAAALAITTVLMSASRGGLLVLLTVLAVYGVARLGWRGAVGMGALAVPLALYGGRGTAAAESSTVERLEIWLKGLDTVATYPLLGMGHGQFVAEHDITAHNSVLLAAAETGLVGALCWTGAMYVSLKIPLRVLIEVDEPEAEVARVWALSLCASIAGIAVGAMFLSFNYHFVLWTYLAMSGVLWAAVKQHRPDFEVPIRLRDGLLIAAITCGVLAAMFAATRLKLG